MSESSFKNGFSAVNTEGQIIDEDIARQMADKESKLRKKYTKEYTKEMSDLTKEELEATIAPTADKAAENIFKKEAGMEYADAVKEAQEAAAYEINAVENSVKGETKKDVEIIKQKPGVEGKDNSDAKKVVKNYQDVIQDAKTDSETKIAPVVSRVEIKETNQDRLNKVKKEVKKRVIEIQETIDILDGKKGGRGEVLTYLKQIAGIKDRDLTKDEEKKYWGRAMYRLKAEKQGYEVVDLFFENNDSPADWEKFQKHLQFSLKSEKNLADEYINKIDKDSAASNQNKPIEQRIKEAVRDSKARQDVISGFMDKNDEKKEKQKPIAKPKTLEEIEEEIIKWSQEIDNIRKGVAEAEAVGDKEKASKLEKAIEWRERKMRSNEEKIARERAKKDGSKPTDKPDASVEVQPPMEGDTQKPSKNSTEKENDEAETKHKANGPIYANESIPDDAQEAAERIKNGKKANKAEEGADKKEESASAEAMASKEKTAEEILRDKNIEAYGGPEKFNKIVEAYQKLNELVDKKANLVDDKGNPVHKELYKEWDALRVNLAGAKMVAMDEKMGIDIHGEKEIKDPETKIREFYDKLSDPVEIFAKDSTEDTIVRAATLIKHRNELADRLSRVKNANTEAQIRDLDNKIEILNQKLSERRDPSKPATPLSELVISSFKKAEVKKGEESAEEKINREAEEIKSELEKMPKEERRKIGSGFWNLGFKVQEIKSRLMASILDKGSEQVLERFGAKDSQQRKLPIQTQNILVRFFSSLGATYRNDEKRARQMMEDQEQSPSTMKRLQSIGFLSSNSLKIGRTIAELAGYATLAPIRGAIIGAQAVARGAEAAKYTRLQNAEVIDKTRLGSEKITNYEDAYKEDDGYRKAFDEAFEILENAKKMAEKQGKTLSEKDGGAKFIEQAYVDNLPKDLLSRLEKAKPGTTAEAASSIFQKIMKKQIELSVRYGGKISKRGYEKRLKEFDGMLSKYGTVDAMAMSAHYMEKTGKAAILALSVESAYLLIKKLPHIFEGASGVIADKISDLRGGGHIFPQEGGTPNGDMAGYESGKGPEMFPGEKYFGQEASSEKAKDLVARFYEESRYNPEWKNSLLEQGKALQDLTRQLEEAGIKDPDTLKEILADAKEQLNGDGKIFIGGSQEAQNLAGIESTGGSGGGSTAEQTATAAGAGKSVDAVVGAKTGAAQFINEIKNVGGIKHDSIWRSTHDLIQSKAKELGLEYPGAGKTKLTETDWYNAKTSQFVNELDKSTPGGIKDLVHEGDKIALTKGGDGEFHLSVEESSGINSSRLADLHHNVAGVKASVIENASSDPEFAPIHQEPIWEPMVNQPQATDHPWDNQPKQTAGNRLNEIFDYPFGRQGAETITYQNVKNEIAENFLRRNLSREVDVNDPFAIDSDDARRYGELQNYINDMAKKPGNYPRAGETVDQFIHRMNRNIVMTPEHAVTDAAPGKTMPPHESSQELEIDEEFFNENQAVDEVFKGPEVIAAAKPIHLSRDNFYADIQFKYNQSGEPISVDWIDAKIDGVQGSEYYEANYLKTIAKGFKEAGFALENDARENASEAGRYLMELIKIHDELINRGEKQGAAVLLDHIKEEIGIINTRYGQEIINSEKLPQEIREKLGK